MKLAFSGQGRYTDYSDGYNLYLKRSKKETPLDEKTYKRVVRDYCKMLSERFKEEGMIDLPDRLGTIFAAEITRKPQYRGKKFIGYGKMDWKKGHFDGKLKTFGLVFLPRRGKENNLRSFGYVANRRLFKDMKERYTEGKTMWGLMEFNEEMI